MAFMLPPRPPRSARQPRPAAAPPAVDPTPALTARLEFLLSDSNLHKDAHLRELLEAHRGYVPLAAVAAFPRVAAVPGVSVAALAAAVLTSPLLALSPDGATVCRRVPYVHAPADAYDDRTVYVEGFPAASATHDSLTAFFSRWGAVTHVSLPKWRGQGKRCVGSAGVWRVGAQGPWAAANTDVAHTQSPSITLEPLSPSSSSLTPGAPRGSRLWSSCTPAARTRRCARTAAV